MNREIKFRGYYKDESYQDEGLEYSKLTNSEVTYLDGTTESRMVDDSTVKEIFCYQNSDVAIMQYTGVKDSNDTEIYEGDIHAETFRDDGEHFTSHYQILFDNGAFWVDESLEQDGSELILLAEYGEPIDIVGNIYENPELIKNYNE